MRRGRGIGLLLFGVALLALLTLSLTSNAMSPRRRGPPPFISANDGMSCAGTLIQPGYTLEQVLRLCGTPTSTRHWGAGKSGWLEMWRYERYGSCPRMLRFENGVLVSIAAISPS